MGGTRRDTMGRHLADWTYKGALVTRMGQLWPDFAVVLHCENSNVRRSRRCFDDAALA